VVYRCKYPVVFCPKYRLDERIANQRRDFHHKVSRQLVEENQFIGLEDLNIQGMMHPLAKSIGDAGVQR